MLSDGCCFFPRDSLDGNLGVASSGPRMGGHSTLAAKVTLECGDSPRRLFDVGFGAINVNRIYSSRDAAVPEATQRKRPQRNNARGFGRDGVH